MKRNKHNKNHYKLSRVEIDDETKMMLKEFARHAGVPFSKSLHALIERKVKVGK